MFELLLSTLRKPQPTENSGPGPQTFLRGDINHGFMGEVPASALSTVEEFKDTFLSTLTGAVFNTNQIVWLKFAIDGEYYFLPKQAIVSNISWNDIYSAGLIYGTDDNGKYPNTGITPKNQMTLFEKDNNKFIISTLEVSSADPHPGAIGSWPVEYRTSQFAKTLLAVTKVIGKPADVMSWDFYELDDIKQMSTSSPLAKESRQSDPAVTAIRVTNSHAGFSTARKDITTTYYEWRPLLKLVKPNE